MGAQLSRIGVGRSLLVVLVCCVLSLVGLTRSGVAGDSGKARTERPPEVLAPPKVADPELGDAGVSATPAHRASTAPAGSERTKTCVTALGQKLKVPHSFHCPKVARLRNQAAKDLRSGKIAPPAQAPKSIGTPPVTTKTVTTAPKTVTKQPPAAKQPPVGGSEAPNN